MAHYLGRDAHLCAFACSTWCIYSPPPPRPASPAITDPDSDSIYSPAVAAATDADVDAGAAREIVVPLVHDTKFYALLSTTLESIAERLSVIHADFVRSLQDLARDIADTAQPASVAANFHPPSSVTTHAGALRVKTGELKVRWPSCVIDGLN